MPNQPRSLSRTAALRAARLGAVIRIATLDPADPILIRMRDRCWQTQTPGGATWTKWYRVTEAHVTALLTEAGPGGFSIDPEAAPEDTAPDPMLDADAILRQYEGREEDIPELDEQPTAYEASLARRTGASVEQLRAESSRCPRCGLFVGAGDECLCSPTVAERLIAADEDDATPATDPDPSYPDYVPPTPEQQAAYDKMVAAYKALTEATAALRLILEPSEDDIECIAGQLADFRPQELMDELGDAYVLDQVWDMRFVLPLED